MGSRRPVRKDVLTHLRRLREALGLDLYTLASMSGISPHTLHSYEIGARRPRPDKWRYIHRALVVWLMQEWGYDRAKATDFISPRLVPLVLAQSPKVGARRKTTAS